MPPYSRYCLTNNFVHFYLKLVQIPELRMRYHIFGLSDRIIHNENEIVRLDKPIDFGNVNKLKRQTSRTVKGKIECRN